MKRYLILLAASALAACSGPAREPSPDESPAAAATAPVTLSGDGAQDVSAWAFREQEGTFLFDTLLRKGWTADGRLNARLRRGRYKFLFACGAGGGLAMRPEPVAGVTGWDEALFSLRENPELPGTHLPAGELFLQHPAADANTVYELDGTPLTVAARLTRAVCQITVTLKRGYRDGTRYIEVPYPAPRSVLDEIGSVELSALNTGLTVTPEGSGGQAEVRGALAAADYGELTEEGFARLDGPMVVPPAGGADLELDLKVIPAEGSALQPRPIRLTGKAERNKRLDVTLWLAPSNPEIGVEIVTRPIASEQEGDAGIWE